MRDLIDKADNECQNKKKEVMLGKLAPNMLAQYGSTPATLAALSSLVMFSALTVTTYTSIRKYVLTTAKPIHDH
jgi:hypothetical protein